MNVLGTRRVTRRDWLAAAAMTAGLGVLLLAASPSGGRPHAPASLWWLAGLLTLAAVVTGLAIAFGMHRGSPASARRRAVVLGAVTGIAWGFVAAVIKEFSSHLGQGLGPIVGSWSLYVLIGAGAASLLLASHALAAAHWPRRSRGSPSSIRSRRACSGCSCSASTSRPRRSTWSAEALALALLAGGVLTLSHSRLLAAEDNAPGRRSGLAIARAPTAPAAVGDGQRTERLVRIPQSPGVRSGR